MTIEVTCPYCSYSRDLPRDSIPPSANHAVCPRCKGRFEFRIPSGTPWERRSELGLWPSIGRTFKMVLFSPGRLFENLPAKNGLAEPFAFGLLSGSVGGMFSLFWHLMTPSTGGGFFHSATGPYGAGLLFSGLTILVPFFVALALFFYSGLLHLFLVVVRGGGNGFGATFKVVSYSQAAQIWSILPFVGGVVSGIWQIVVQIIGFRKIHGTRYWKVIAAFLMPVVVFTVLAVALVLPLFLSLFP